MERRAFTLREVSESTGQAIGTLKAHIRAGSLKTVRPGGGERGRLLVRADDLDDYLNRWAGEFS